MFRKIGIILICSIGFQRSYAGLTTMKNVVWRSCNSKAKCISLSAENIGSSTFYGEDYLFAQNVKIGIIEYGKLNTYFSNSALWNNKRKIWTIFKATEGKSKVTGDYFFVEGELTFNRY